MYFIFKKKQYEKRSPGRGHLIKLEFYDRIWQNIVDIYGTGLPVATSAET